VVVLRQAENADLSGSLYQRAKNEWDIRQQGKVTRTAENGKGGIFIEAGGNVRIDSTLRVDEGATVGIAAGKDFTSKRGKILQGKELVDERRWFSMDNPLVWIVVSLTLAALTYFFFKTQ
jgi:hypothetical protein